MYGTTFNKLMYFESEFLNVHVCGKRKREVGLVCDLNTENRPVESCWGIEHIKNTKERFFHFEFTEQNAMCKPLLIKQETEYHLHL